MISDSEYKVMQVLWKKAPCNAKTVVNELVSTTEWKEKTIKTLLNRLLNKDVIGAEKQGREYLYSPKVNQEDFQQQASRTFLSQIFDGKLSQFVSHFAQKETISKSEIEQLKRIIKDLDNG